MSNLPPGCRESDIPGNRPIDEAYDAWTEDSNAEELRIDAIQEALDDEGWDMDESVEIRAALDRGVSSFEIVEMFGYGDALSHFDSMFERWYDALMSGSDEPDDDRGR